MPEAHRNFVYDHQNPVHADHFANQVATLDRENYQIILELLRAGKVKIELLTMSGKRIKSLAEQYHHQGAHHILFSIAELNVEWVTMFDAVESDGIRKAGKFIDSSR